MKARRRRRKCYTLINDKSINILRNEEKHTKNDNHENIENQ